MRKTKKAYTEYLNQHYADMDQETQIDQLDYLTNPRFPNRFEYITHHKLIIAIQTEKCGALLRKYDPIAFMVGFNEWVLQNQKP